MSYEPYGDEWEKEMMKLTKKELIAMVKRLQDPEKVKVSKAPLLDVMRSIVGPSYLIRELQATRGLGNPVDILVNEINQDNQ